MNVPALKPESPTTTGIPMDEGGAPPPPHPSPPEAMTKHERYSLLVAIVALVLEIGGFIFVIVTLHQNTKALQRTVYVNASFWVIDLDKSFIQKPELRPYFYDNVPVKPGDKHYAEAVIMAELVVDTMDAFLEHRLGTGQNVHEGWINWMKEMLNQSPILRTYMAEHDSWYATGKFYQVVYKEWLDEEGKKKLSSPPSAGNP